MILEADQEISSRTARLEAAEALLGVSPNTTATLVPNVQPKPLKLASTAATSVGPSAIPFTASWEISLEEQSLPGHFKFELPFSTTRTSGSRSKSSTKPVRKTSGLDALAMLASSAQAMECQSPSPRRSSRPRSVSNPEGMEKWDSLRFAAKHLVQPTIFEDSELDQDTPATFPSRESSRTPSPSALRSNKLPLKKRTAKVSFAEQDKNQEHVVPRYIGITDVSPHDTVLVEPDPQQDSSLDAPNVSSIKAMSEHELKEFLTQARGKILDDVVTCADSRLGCGNLVLPQDLTKYRDVYNKNGRIGVYTASERAAIIARFQAKRSRRVWNKKIRYSCRKNLADRRLRVKGRFVKRTPETGASIERSDSPTPQHDFLASVVEDNDMPDTQDQDAGFCPTDDQPYRRTRRHTIT